MREDCRLTGVVLQAQPVRVQELWQALQEPQLEQLLRWLERSSGPKPFSTS